MVSLDFRTRFDSDVVAVDVTEFFEHQLPELAAARADLAVPGALELGIDPFTIDMDEGAWTLSIAGDAILVAHGDAGRAAVRLSAAELTDIVFDLQTPMTLLTAGTLRMERGNLGHFLDWWVVLRSLIDGVPIHTAGSIAFRDRQGEPLDLHTIVRARRRPRGRGPLSGGSRLSPPDRRLQRRGDGPGVGGHGCGGAALRTRRRPLVVGAHRGR